MVINPYIFHRDPNRGSFITTWETTTPDESITIPTTGGGYNYRVDWGDGTVTQGHTGNATHIYAVAGIYTVKISGDFPRIYFNNGGDRLKIKSIEQWGSGVWAPFSFWGCENMVGNYTDVPNLTNISGSLAHAFRECHVFNGSVAGWDVSGVTNLASFFLRAYVFDQDLSSWDVGNVTSMTTFLNSVTLSTANYDATLIAWAGLPVLQSGLNFHGGNSKYSPAAVAARNILINDYGWNITDGGPV